MLTEAYVDISHENSRYRRDLSSVFNNQDNEFDNNKLFNLGTITVNRNPNLDKELANKKTSMMNYIKKLFLDLIKHYKTISKSPLALIHIILLNMIKYKVQIKHFLNILIVVDIFYRNGY